MTTSEVFVHIRHRAKIPYRYTRDTQSPQGRKGRFCAGNEPPKKNPNMGKSTVEKNGHVGFFLV